MLSRNQPYPKDAFLVGQKNVTSEGYAINKALKYKMLNKLNFTAENSHKSSFLDLIIRKWEVYASNTDTRGPLPYLLMHPENIY